MASNLIDVLMSKFDYSRERAEREVNEAREEILDLLSENQMPYDYCERWGLEPDYPVCNVRPDDMQVIVEKSIVENVTQENMCCNCGYPIYQSEAIHIAETGESFCCFGCANRYFEGHAKKGSFINEY